MTEKQRKIAQVLQFLAAFAEIKNPNTDEIGWIALKYSCTRQEAERKIKAARKAAKSIAQPSSASTTIE